jgi:toxin-antitoxin system PIN domain toxin
VSRTALLDVNVLVALFDPDHVHHELAHDWFKSDGRASWATCPLTENGLLRVLAHPAYGGTVRRVTDLLARLRRFCESGGHVFWQDTLSLRDATVFDSSMVAGHRQLTDIYLLGLAHTHKGSLATFDRSIPIRAVMGGSARDLTVITPAD